ncbi:MAG: endolytic transglycosylase MltG [Myxococcaceae bacterium]
MKRLLAVVLALLVLAVAASSGAFLWAQGAVAAPGPKGDGAELIFTVPKKTTARGIGRLLAEQGLIDSPRLWRFCLWRRGGLEAKAGQFKLKRGQSMAELATALEGAPLPEDVPFVVVEGWRLRDTDAALAAKGFIRAGEYVAAASAPGGYTAPFPLPSRSLEGYLYPETYRVPKEGLQVAVLIQRQLDTFVERVFTPYQDEVKKSPRTLDALVTLASMLEREEPTPAQRPLVAGIMWKRIDRGIPLGVDATSRYELEEWNDRKRFLERLRDEADPYNTRTRAGLPPTPIGSPTEASFAAALRPVSSEFLYYLHDAEKKLHPSRNWQEHEALRKRYNVY